MSDKEQTSNKDIKALHRRIISYFRPYSRKIALLIFVILLVSIFGLMPPLCVKGMVDYALPERDGWLLALLILGMALSNVIAEGFKVLQAYLAAVIGQNVIADLRQAVIRSLLHQSLRFYTSEKGGAIASRVQYDVVGIQSAATNMIVDVVSSALALIATMVAMLIIDFKLSLLSAALLPLFIFPTNSVSKRRKELQQQSQEQLAKLGGHSTEKLSLSGHILLRLFSHPKNEEERFLSVGKTITEIHLKQAVIHRKFLFMLSLFQTLGPAALMAYGGYRALIGDLSIGTIVAFASFLSRLYTPASTLSTAKANWDKAEVIFERIFQTIDRVPEIEEPKNPTPLPNPIGEIRFEDVTFCYESGRKVLDRVSFTVKAGEKIAIVGHSGAGKTTISYLVPRLYDPTEGRVLLDGHDLRSLSFDTIAKCIGKVTQESYMLHATVAENLRYAKPDATQEELEEACKAAQIHEVIERLSHKYETVVGEKGYRFSGGERQRLSIARVLLRNPKVLVLDEATGALDSESEAKIQEALVPLLENRTSIIIAHRFSTVLSADRILVLDKGRIVESGNHKELLAKQGLYAHLYKIQFNTEKKNGATSHPEESNDDPMDDPLLDDPSQDQVDLRAKAS